MRVGDTIKVCRPDGTGDVGPKLTEYGKRVATEQTAELSGFVFCAKSPSCGMERIKIYNEAGTGNTSEGVGFFAEQIMAHNPLLPCEENGRLNDMHLRENFVMRVYTYKHWQTLSEQPLTVHRLTQFHAQYKYLLMAHNYEAYRSLGNLLGTFDGEDIQTLADEYILGLMTALKKPASRKNNANTLMHLQGYFKKSLSKVEKQELRDAIDEYRQGLVPYFTYAIKHHLKCIQTSILLSKCILTPIRTN